MSEIAWLGLETKKHALIVSPAAARHLHDALTEEIARQDAIGAKLDPNADWPDDYEPNDVAVYRGWCTWLEEAKLSGGRLEDPTGKPLEFMMSWLPYHARKYQDRIPADELEQLFRTYAEYVAAFCATVLPEELERMTSRAKTMQRMLLNVLRFPRGEKSPDRSAPR